jgi:hypothetical protein
VISPLEFLLKLRRLGQENRLLTHLTFFISSPTTVSSKEKETIIKLNNPKSVVLLWLKTRKNYVELKSLQRSWILREYKLKSSQRFKFNVRKDSQIFLRLKFPENIDSDFSGEREGRPSLVWSYKKDLWLSQA